MLKPHEVCGFFFKKLFKIDCGSCKDPFDLNWTVSIPENKPRVIPPPKVSWLTILHMLGVIKVNTEEQGLEEFSKSFKSRLFDFHKCIKIL